MIAKTTPVFDLPLRREASDRSAGQCTPTPARRTPHTLPTGTSHQSPRCQRDTPHRPRTETVAQECNRQPISRSHSALREFDPSRCLLPDGAPSSCTWSRLAVRGSTEFPNRGFGADVLCPGYQPINAAPRGQLRERPRRVSPCEPLDALLAARSCDAPYPTQVRAADVVP